MSSSSPYKSFNDKFPSGTNWYDYYNWLRIAFYKHYECDHDGSNIESDDEAFNEEEDEEEDSNNNNNSKEKKKKAKASNNNKGEDNSYSESSSDEKSSSESEVSHPKDDIPKETHFKGYFAFLIWEYIPPPGFEKFKSVSMNVVGKPNDGKNKKLSRATTKKEESEQKVSNALLD